MDISKLKIELIEQKKTKFKGNIYIIILRLILHIIQIKLKEVN